MPTTFEYFPNVPNAPDDPADDQPQMQVNTLSTQNLIAVDHVGFKNSVQGVNNSGGFHTIVHQDIGNRTRSGSGAVPANFPTAIPNINQVFTALYTNDATVTTTDTQLFNLTGNGGLSQLTGNDVRTSNTDGWCWVGGILLQWGAVTINSTSFLVSFQNRIARAIPFPNQCVNVQLTPLGGTAFTAQIAYATSLSKTDFTLKTVGWNTSGGNAGVFQWLAVGY